METTRRTVLVTGAGTGMGLEAARRFAADGSRVLMVARNEERLRAEAAGLEGAIAFACDITDEDQVARLVELAGDEGVDTVLLNAGVTHTYAMFGDVDIDVYGRAELEMQTNYLSAVRLITSLVPVIERHDAPALIVTTSGVAFAPDITNPTYSASKAALHSLVLTVRLQLERNGSPTKVFEFMAPLVDSPFSAGVASTEKMPPEEAVALLFEGLRRDELELHVGITQDVYQALRRSSDAAVRAVNAATGG